MNEERAKRKLSAILSADAVGYSRLMEEDEASTIRTLADRKELMITLIHQYRGRVVDAPGDNLLAEFGSVVDATECAVNIQQVLQAKNLELPDNHRMQFRIGINLGDVIEEDGRIYGNGVNITARVEGLAEGGGICISGTVYDQIKNKLNVGFVDLGEQTVKNISTPVRAYRIRPDSPTSSPNHAAQREPPPDKPAIAVLPFVNMSGDPEQEYFSDGITEDLITDISKISGLFVIARNSTFTYKGRSVDVRQIANDLGVRYVLEGSVRKAAGKVRINAQLIDSTTGTHLWAERYDGSLDDIFALQDEITGKIVSGLEVKLTAAERKRTGERFTSNVGAYDLFLRGRTEFHRFTETANAEAKRNFETAIKLDSNFAAAYTYLSLAHMLDWVNLWEGYEKDLDLALEIAQKAVALDDTLGMAHMRLGWIHNFRGEHEKAIASLERAFALDPNNAEVCSYFAEALNYYGDPERAIALTEKAVRFDPLLPPHLAFPFGHSYFLLRRYDDAVSMICNTIDRVPSFVVAHVFLSVVYSEIDRMPEAAAEIETVLKLVPEYTLSLADERFPHRLTETQNRLLEGLRKAGLPD